MSQNAHFSYSYYFKTYLRLCIFTWYIYVPDVHVPQYNII